MNKKMNKPIKITIRYYKYYNVIEDIRCIINDIKWLRGENTLLCHHKKGISYWFVEKFIPAYQRAKRCYSYKDIGNVDCWFLRVFPSILESLKVTINAHCECEDEGLTWSEDGLTMNSNDALDRMIHCFREYRAYDVIEEYDKQRNVTSCTWFRNEYDIHGDRIDFKELQENELPVRISEMPDYLKQMKNEAFDLLKIYFDCLID
jgi:hypothetical protein